VPLKRKHPRTEWVFERSGGGEGGMMFEFMSTSGRT
jgi:hypothetical protein